MNHLQLFESYSDKAAQRQFEKTIETFFNGSEVSKLLLHERCDAFMDKFVIKFIKGEVENEQLLTLLREYIWLLSFLSKKTSIDLTARTAKSANIPFPITPSTKLGKVLSSKDEVSSKALIDCVKIRKPQQHLEALMKSEETPTAYLTSLGNAYEYMEKYPNTKSKRVAALCFVVYTYDKLRTLFMAQDNEGTEDTSGGEKKDADTNFFGGKSQGRGIGLGSATVKGLGLAVASLVLPVTSFVSQGSDLTGCFRACQKMIGKQAPPGLGIKVAKETSGGVVKLPTFDKGIGVIDKTLAAGKPIIVGVDDKKGSVNHDKTTDHFVVIVGSGKDNRGTFYQFFDPGTSHKDKGTHDENRFYLDDNGLYSGTSAYNKGSKVYTMSWVRPTA